MEWKTEKKELSVEHASADGRWSMSIREDMKAGRKHMALVNFDVLSGPCAVGGNSLECWRNFVCDCDACTERLAKVRAEAEAQVRMLEADNTAEEKLA